MSKSPLTDKQKRLVDEYQIDGNATRAARAAGYAEKYAGNNAYHVLRTPKVAEELAARQRERAERLGISADRIVEKLAAMGFANVVDFVVPGPNGEPIFDVFCLDRVQAAALTELDAVVPGGQDDGAAGTTKRAKVRLPDQRAVLVSLARLLGYFRNVTPAPTPQTEEESPGNIVFEDEYVEPSPEDR